MSDSSPPLDMKYEPFPNPATLQISDPTVAGIYLKQYMDKHESALDIWFRGNNFKLEPHLDKILNEINKYLLFELSDPKLHTSIFSIEQVNYLAKILQFYSKLIPELKTLNRKDFNQITKLMILIVEVAQIYSEVM